MAHISLSAARSILGIQNKHDIKEIKSRFRALAMQYHPDHGGDPDKFKQIADAYFTIMNWDKTDIVASGIETDIFDSLWEEWVQQLSPDEQERIANDIRELERDE